MNESKHKKKQKKNRVAPPITYTAPKLKIWTKKQLFNMDCVASVYTKDIAGMSIPQLKDYIQKTCENVKLNSQFVYSRHHIGNLVSHHAVNKEMKKVSMSSIPYVLNNGHPVTKWAYKPDPKNLIDSMQSCLYGAPIMIDGVKYLCLLTVKFNHLTGKIFPYVVNVEDENGMKVSDDIMVNNNNTTTPSNSGTSTGTVTSQDNSTPSNPIANLQQNIETTKDNSEIKTESKHYMRKLKRIISESARKVLNEAKWINGNDEPIDGPDYDSIDNPSQNNLSPIDRYHPDYWYYRQEEEPYDPTYDEGYLDDYTVNNDDEFKDDLNDWGIKENKQYNKNRNMKQTIKLRESELKRMISESVRRVLKETGFLSEGKFVNNKPIDWNKISDDDVNSSLNFHI